MAGWPRLGRAGLTVAYPVAIYAALQWFEPRYIALTLAAIVIVQQRNRAGRMLHGLAPAAWAGAAFLIALSVAAWLGNDEHVLRLWPAGMNVALLLVFGGSLLRPPPMIERFARLLHPDLPPAGVRYTRRVTQVWCAFFVLNGSIAAYTALAATRETWVLYNGLIAYLLVGALFCGEWLVRQRVLAADHR